MSEALSNVIETVNNAQGIKVAVASAGMGAGGAAVSQKIPPDDVVNIFGMVLTSGEISAGMFVTAVAGLLLAGWQGYIGHQRMIQSRRANDLKERELNGRDNNDT